MFLKRKIVFDIQKWVSKKEIIILIWPRQVWKTTLLKYFFDKTEWQKIWFDLDKLKDCDVFSNYDKLIDFLKLQFDINQKITLFVDEFQYCKNSEIIFKNLYDSFDNIKIFASGSSSLNIKNLIQESLAWRKKIFKIYPLSLEEFILWKNWENFDIKVFKDIKNIKDIWEKYLKLLYQFMVRWWYPQIVLDEDLAKEHLENIFDLYLKKDILDLLNIKNIDSFKKLIQYLAINHWQQVNYSQLANFASIDIGTVKNYIDILQETFLIKKVVPFFSNKNKEISKAPKIYFIDNWVRNYFIKNFLEEIDLRIDKWVLFEWVILQELIKRKFDNIKYWRTKTKQEVDFIIDNVVNIDAIEVKFKENLCSKDFYWLNVFSKLYSKILSKMYLISKYWCDKKFLNNNIDCINLFTFLSIINE